MNTNGLADMQRLADRVQDADEKDQDAIINELERMLPSPEGDVDLAEYRRSQSSSSTLADRVQRLKEFIGFTPQRTFARRLDGAKNVLTVFDKAVNSYTGQLEEQEERLHSDENELGMVGFHLHLLQGKYERKLHHYEQLEVEVEEKQQTSPHGVSSVLYEKRQQLNNARKEKEHLYDKMEKAAVRYSCLRDSVHARREHVVSLRDRVERFRKQSTAVAVRINQWELQQTVHFGGEHPAIKELYEELAVMSDGMRRFYEANVAGESPDGIDSAYDVRFSSPGPDELIDRWKQLSESR